MRQTKFIVLAGLLTIATTIAMVACKHEPPVTPIVSGTNGNNSGTNGNNGATGTNGNDSTATSGADTSICFERDILPIFVTNCVRSGCHDAGSRAEGYVLDNYNNITSRGIVSGNASGSKIYRTLTASGEDMMPQGGPPLTASQLDLIRRWINQGAPNGTNCAVTCDTSTFTYSGAVRTIMSTYCLGCHSSSAASSAGGGYVLDNYNDVKTVALNGMLVGVLTPGSAYPSMPLSGAALSACQVTQIKKWVNAGALNN